MKLTEIENEQALDFLADVIDPIAKIMSDEKVEKMNKAQKPVLTMASYILKSHKKEVIEIVAMMHGENPATYRFNTVSLLHDVVDVLNDPDVLSLFSLQGQMMEDEHSGSATENTEEKEQ